MESLIPIERGFQPETYGKYFLIDKVAVGGMAEVFRAKTFSHGGFEKLLVIKRILQHLSDNSEFVEMFIDEAKISVMLQQPNIVAVYDFGRIRDNYFIAMECVEGKDLKILLRKLAERRKLLPIEFAVFIAHEVCKGLDYAHKKTTLKGEPMGIVHRDMSPSNILISYNGEIKIADFGIAKAETSAYSTKDGVLKGKFEYMSPEQASGQTIDARSDLFSVGIMLHEMLTGRRLFKSDSEIKTLERIRAADVKPPSATNPNIPSRLDDLVMKALSRDPKDRYQDGKEMQTDLLEFLYPATPDITRDSLSHFMQQLFITELAEERDRMEEGTKAALKLWEEEPELEIEPAWQEGGSASTMTRPASRLPLLIALLLVVVAGGAAVYFATRTVAPEVQVVTEAAPLPTTGTLDLRISPVGAHAWLGAQDMGTGTALTWDKVPPDQELTLKVEAPGYLPFSDTVNLKAGERLRLPVVLTPVPVVPVSAPQTSNPVRESPRNPVQPVNTAVSSAAEGPGHVSVNVSSGWADVYIDGQKVDSTPMANHEISAGTHTIRVVNAAAGIDATRTVKIAPGKAEKVFFPVD